ncbi:hypothetical protein GQ457_07G036330 [Hibiscus cannabinus]
MAFKFAADWILEESCAIVISDFWSSHTEDLPTKLINLRLSLKRWSNTLKHENRKMKETLEKRLSELEGSDPDDDVLEEVITVKLALNIEADKEELSWEQRTRVNWLSKGDRNTTFFS